MQRKVPSKADIRGSIPGAFLTGANLVNVVDATKLTNMILAMLAARMRSLWILSNGSRRAIPETASNANALKQLRLLLWRSNLATQLGDSAFYTISLLDLRHRFISYFPVGKKDPGDPGDSSSASGQDR
jgi:hypothetical protein